MTTDESESIVKKEWFKVHEGPPPECINVTGFCSYKGKILLVKQSKDGVVFLSELKRTQNDDR